MENNCGVCGSAWMATPYDKHLLNWCIAVTGHSSVRTSTKSKWICACAMRTRSAHGRYKSIYFVYWLSVYWKRRAETMRTCIPVADRSKRRQYMHGDAENNGPTPNGCEKRIKFWLPSNARNKNTHQMKLKQNRKREEKKKFGFSPNWLVVEMAHFRTNVCVRTKAKGIKNKSETDDGNRKTMKMLIIFFLLLASQLSRTEPNQNSVKKIHSTQVKLTFVFVFQTPARFCCWWVISVGEVAEPGKRDHKKRCFFFFIKWLREKRGESCGVFLHTFLRFYRHFRLRQPAGERSLRATHECERDWKWFFVRCEGRKGASSLHTV